MARRHVSRASCSKEKKQQKRLVMAVDLLDQREGATALPHPGWNWAHSPPMLLRHEPVLGRRKHQHVPAYSNHDLHSKPRADDRRVSLDMVSVVSRASPRARACHSPAVLRIKTAHADRSLSTHGSHPWGASVCCRPYVSCSEPLLFDIPKTDKLNFLICEFLSVL
jgi:hypothetical protein